MLLLQQVCQFPVHPDKLVVGQVAAQRENLHFALIDSLKIETGRWSLLYHSKWESSNVNATVIPRLLKPLLPEDCAAVQVAKPGFQI